MTSSNKDVDNTPAQDKALIACKSECMANPKCSAVEWYEKGYGENECSLILSDANANNIATKGASGSRWKDGVCFIKPGKDFYY